MKILKPMLATIGDKSVLCADGYIYEPKYDGYRALCYVNKELTFISRNGNDISADYPEFNFRSNIKAQQAVLDGEIIIYNNKGIPDFSLLQRSGLHEYTATYVVFDILMYNRADVTQKPLLERKQLLKKIIKEIPFSLELSPYTTDGLFLWKAIQKIHFEGVMAKEAKSYYFPGQRRPQWLKIKERQTLDCIIIGYTSERRAISSLILALYDKKTLVYVGKVGTGFSEKTIQELYKKFSALKRATPACPTPTIAHATWITPRYVAEISYQQRTRDNRLRIPAFIRLRTDKKPKDCTIQQ